MDDEVASLDKFDTHLLGQEGMLEIGRIMDAWRQHHRDRVVLSGNSETFEYLKESARIVIYRPDL